jgi:2-dehydro-3-deoxygalactonokinase
VNIDWIAVEYSAAALQAWAIGQDGQVLAQLTTQKTAYADAQNLLNLIDPWLASIDPANPVNIVACGIVAPQTDYTPAPCRPLATSVRAIPITDPRATLHVTSSISQHKPADVILGEEAQIAGFQAKFPNFDGVICLTGWHSKWVHVSAGEIVSFQSFMTGELIATLSQSRSLKDCLQNGIWADSAFYEALTETLSRPERLAAKLLTLRAEHLLNAAHGGSEKAQLSGLLIGMELASAKPYWLGQMVAVIGTGALSEMYIKALATQGVTALTADPTEMTLAGLSLARTQNFTPKDEATS